MHKKGVGSVRLFCELQSPEDSEDFYVVVKDWKGIRSPEKLPEKYLEGPHFFIDPETQFLVGKQGKGLGQLVFTISKGQIIPAEKWHFIRRFMRYAGERLYEIARMERAKHYWRGEMVVRI